MQTIGDRLSTLKVQRSGHGIWMLKQAFARAISDTRIKMDYAVIFDMCQEHKEHKVVYYLEIHAGGV